VAKDNLIKMLFSLQSIYDKGQDTRVCLFVRLCGLYDALPAMCTNFALESVEIISAVMSGSNLTLPFRSPSLFWAHWTSGKLLDLDPKWQEECLNAIFQRHFPPGQLMQRLQSDLQSKPEQVPSYVKLPKGAVSLTRFLEFVLRVQMLLRDKNKIFVAQKFKARANKNGVIESLGDFEKAVVDLGPASMPVSGSLAFMFYKSALVSLPPDHTLIKKPLTTKSIIQDARGAVEKLEDKGEGMCTVDAAIDQFLWWHGKMSTCGLRADGSSALAEARRHAKGLNPKVI